MESCKKKKNTIFDRLRHFATAVRNVASQQEQKDLGFLAFMPGTSTQCLWKGEY